MKNAALVLITSACMVIGFWSQKGSKYEGMNLRGYWGVICFSFIGTLAWGLASGIDNIKDIIFYFMIFLFPSYLGVRYGKKISYLINEIADLRIQELCKGDERARLSSDWLEKEKIEIISRIEKRINEIP